MSAQLPLFAEADRGESGPPIATVVSDEARMLARKLAAIAPWLRLGTSSWTFPGWSGVVYAGSPSTRDLTERGLAAYSNHPLFRTVGIDRSHYGPLTQNDLAIYARDLADKDFVCVSKVWEEVSTYIFPSHARYGKNAGRINPSFLDPRKFSDEILASYTHVFAHYMGPFVVEIAPIPRDALPSPRWFTGRIDAFLSAIPKGVRVAFELRNRELFIPDYFHVLKKHNAAHVFNMWTGVAPIGEQMKLRDSFTADFVVSRLMLPPYARYEELKAEYAPFDRIVAPQHEMRRDTVALTLEAARRNVKDMFVLVNNKAEGSSPHTVFALASMIVRVLEDREK